MSEPASWPVFRGKYEEKRPLGILPEAPPWRGLATASDPSVPERELPSGAVELDRRHRRIFKEDELAVINAAIFLRRPLLVEGEPGSGKSSIAYAIAHELDLGPVLKWEIGSRSTLKEGLYRYDALARLHDAQARKSDGDTAAKNGEHLVDDYIVLGPLGTALYPHARPRVLLVDELDKGDLDLPNDLLHVLDNGSFEIEEIQRAKRGKGDAPFEVRLADSGEERWAVPDDGRIRCGLHHPILILTSNRERDFSAVFLRRCLRMETQVPRTEEELAQIVSAHLSGHEQVANALVKKFVDDLAAGKILATDQLLNAVYLSMRGPGTPDGQESLRKAINAVLASLGPR